MKAIIFVILIGSLTGMLIDTARGFERVPAVVDDIPVDYEHVGSEPEYTHGAHCIDGRTF